MRIGQAREGRSRARVFSIVVVAALVAAAALTSLPAASAGVRTGSSTGIRFVVQYRGDYKGDWHSSTVYATDPGHAVPCRGYGETGSLSSSIRTGSTPLMIELSKPFDTVSLTYLGGNDLPRGVVTYNQTTDGYVMEFSGGQCQRQRTDDVGCGAGTFEGWVNPFGNLVGDPRLNRVYLGWEMLAPDASNCSDEITDPGFSKEPTGRATARLDLTKLYRCGVKKPRGCKLTVRGSASYPFHKKFESTDESVETSSTYHVEWSTTFTAVGRA